MEKSVCWFISSLLHVALCSLLLKPELRRESLDHRKRWYVWLSSWPGCTTYGCFDSWFSGSILFKWMAMEPEKISEKQKEILSVLEEKFPNLPPREDIINSLQETQFNAQGEWIWSTMSAIANVIIASVYVFIVDNNVSRYSFGVTEKRMTKGFSLIHRSKYWTDHFERSKGAVRWRNKSGH